MSIEDYVPHGVLALKTEANLSIVNPWFEKSLPIPGNVAEIGCYRGTMSIKYAFWIAALGLQKIVYALDTFEGFQIADRSPGGKVRVGDYADNRDSYFELLQWGDILPIKAIKGDAQKTHASIVGPLSFVWLDLDIDVLLDPVLNNISDRLTSDTIIGLDDYSRPETPTIRPWADSIEATGRWHKVFEDPDAFINFYRVG